MEWLIMLWKKIVDWINGKPQETTPAPAVKKAPYRSPEPVAKAAPVSAPADDEPKLTCTLTNEDSRSLSEINRIKEKTKRRALRHFAKKGRDIHHRVAGKNTDFIEFKYFRRSGTPVTIRWQKVSTTP
jgi:hypothetical protein